MMRLLSGLGVLVVLCASGLVGQQPPQVKPSGKLLIAFSSYKDRPKHPNIFFYEHDGVAGGKIVGSVGTQRNLASADARPCLSHDGRYCAFTHEIENKTSQILFWDLNDQQLAALPVINHSP